MFLFISLLLLMVFLTCVDPPIIRSAGLPAALEEVAGEASLDGGFSAMIEALIQATSSWERKSSCSSRKVYSGGLPRDGLDAANGAVPNQRTHMAVNAMYCMRPPEFIFCHGLIACQAVSDQY